MASTEFNDIVNAELATIAAAQCWPEDALASPFSFMDIWARSNNGEGSAVRDGLALIILRELQTSVDQVAFQNIVDRADFFVVPGNVPGEKEVIFTSRVRLALFKVLNVVAYASVEPMARGFCPNGLVIGKCMCAHQVVHAQVGEHSSDNQCVCVCVYLPRWGLKTEQQAISHSSACTTHCALQDERMMHHVFCCSAIRWDKTLGCLNSSRMVQV